MKYIYLLVVSLLFISCSDFRIDSKNTITLDNIKYSETMLEVTSLHKGKMQKVDVSDKYVSDFLVFDSLLITQTNAKDGFWNFYSINSYKSYGKLLRIGKAKGEFAFPVSLTLHLTMGERSDSIISNIYDFSTGRLYEINVSDFITNKKANITESKLSTKLRRNAFWMKSINDSTMLYRYLEDDQTRQTRVLWSNNKKKDNKNINILNQCEIPNGEDFNIISSLISLSPDKEYVVEAMLGLNCIHVYSLSNEKGFSICVGDDVDQIKDIVSTPFPERKYVFADLRAYNFGFGVLKYDITEKVYQTNGEYYPSILFFDWNGNSLGEIKSDIKFNHFDYDEKKDELYILDSEGGLLKTKIKIPIANAPK